MNLKKAYKNKIYQFNQRMIKIQLEGAQTKIVTMMKTLDHLRMKYHRQLVNTRRTKRIGNSFFIFSIYKFLRLNYW